MMVTAYLLPWLTGAVWWANVESMLRGDPATNWPRALGYGFFLGNLVCAALIAVSPILFGQPSVPAITVALGVMLSVGLLFALARRLRIPLRAADFRAGSPWLMAALLGLILLHLALALWEVSARPLLPWDAWTTWVYRAKIWFLNQQLVPVVGPGEWLVSEGQRVYTIDSFGYPPTVSLLHFWPVQVYGYWSDSLAVMPGYLAGLAIGLGIYGQGRTLGWSPLLALGVVYMTLSLPLMGAHLALPGYADIWLSGFAGLGFVALLHWALSRDRSQLLLGLAFLLLGILIKREGVVWALVGLAFVLVHLLSWKILLAAAAAIVLAVLSGHSLLPLPLAGDLGYADGTLYLAHLGAYPLQPRDISAAILNNLFRHGSWNLLWYFLLPALLLVMLPACRPVRWTFLWLLVSIAAVIAAMFGLSDEARWAKDSTALNRVLLQVLPVIVCALALVWHSLFQPRVAQQPGADG